jgi:hypothetical protein
VDLLLAEIPSHLLVDIRGTTHAIGLPLSRQRGFGLNFGRTDMYMIEGILMAFMKT